MIACPKLSQIEWKTTEIRGLKKLEVSHALPAQVAEILSGCRGKISRASIAKVVRGSLTNVLLSPNDATTSQASKAPLNKRVDLAMQFDYSFFVGDLNYRAVGGATDRFLSTAPTTEEPSERLRGLCEASDELAREMAARRVFVGWAAPVPAFAPTFKVARGPGLDYNAKRAPSWCDRVLSASRGSLRGSLRCVAFESRPGVVSSDHKPVAATFEVDPRPLRPLVRTLRWSLAKATLSTDRREDHPGPWALSVVAFPAACLRAKAQGVLADGTDLAAPIPVDLRVEAKETRTRASLCLVVARPGATGPFGAADVDVPRLARDLAARGAVTVDLPVILDATLKGTLSATFEDDAEAARRRFDEAV